MSRRKRACFATTQTLLRFEAEVAGQLSDPCSDVVTYQPHAFGSFNTALGWLIGVPGLDVGALDRLDARLAAHDDDLVRGPHRVRCHRFRYLAAYVDTDLEQ